MGYILAVIVTAIVFYLVGTVKIDTAEYDRGFQDGLNARG